MAGLLCPGSWGSGGESWDSGCNSAQRFGGRADSFVGYHLDYRYIEFIQSRTEKRRGRRKKPTRRDNLVHSAEVGNWGNAGEAVRCGKQGRERPFDWGRSTPTAARLGNLITERERHLW